MPVPGAVCKPHAPDLTGKDAIKWEHGGENGRGGGEAQAAAEKTQRGSDTTNDASANGEKGDRERR